MIKVLESGSTVITGQHIGLYALLSLKARLKMEVVGLRGRGRSALSIAKDAYGLKGSREKVLAQLEAMIEDWAPQPEVEG